jgi:glucose-1-phosphate cytidylyltransferase
MATLSAVRPPVRFGELELNGNEVINFAEKPRLQKGWINGGFFVLESSIFDFIKGDDVMFEREPLEKIVEINELMAFKHEFFWQCMDTKRDKDILEVMWSENKVPWLV